MSFLQTIHSLPCYVSHGMVLDIGCGRGEVMSLLSQKGYDVFGLDVNLLRLRAGSAFGHIVLGDCHFLPFRDKCFDLVCIFELIHHVYEPEAVLNEALRLMKDNATLCLRENVDDNPLFKLLRSLRPSWQGDPVKTRLTRKKLSQMVKRNFHIVEENLADGNIIWLWFLFKQLVNSERFNTTTRLMYLADQKIGRLSKNRFSCKYTAMCKRRRC